MKASLHEVSQGLIAGETPGQPHGRRSLLSNAVIRFARLNTLP